MNFQRRALTDEKLLELYKSLLLPRMIEEKMLKLLRQGRISKWFSGIGQEAISVGVTAAMEQDEWIMPMHRNLAVFTGRKMPLHKLFMQWQGNKDGYSNGRERSFHFGSKEHFVCGMISHLGPQLSLACGAALSYKLKGEQKIALAFTGEGATSEGDFHEALNTAAVWDLPVIFLVENNGYGLSTPTSEQYRCKDIIDKAKGYGMDAVKINGNNVLEVYETIKGVREYCIKEQKPYLIECSTFRMRGHEEASGVKYVPPELFEEWALKDPLLQYERWLLEQNIFSAAVFEQERLEVLKYINAELEMAFNAVPLIPNVAEEIAAVYKPYQFKNTSISATANKERKFIHAITEGLSQSLDAHPSLVIMGQDIAEYGGAFKVTEGFVEKFGKERIRNTPICESAIVGIALGMSLEGNKAVMEMQFADFATVGFNQIINNLAKLHYRWGENADVVIRMPTGAGVGAGPFHSQSNEAWFVKTPGLKVVYPATAYDAKGLLIAAINDPNPVLFFEHKALYRSITGMVPSGYYEIEIGKAKLVADGDDISIITYGAGVHWATDYAAAHQNISIHILDLRTLLPLDYDAIKAAVKATGRVLVLHEDTLICGIGAEVAAWIGEHCFALLDAPVMRCASLDTPIPFNLDLEKQFLAKGRLQEMVEELMGF